MTTQAHNDNQVEDRHYAVVTQSVRDRTQIMARIAPPHAGKRNFWTTTDLDKVWKMDRATAEDIFGKLHMNNPRIMRYERAIEKLREQMPQAEVLLDDGPSP